MTAEAGGELDDNPGARYVFLGFLGLVFVVGLWWALGTGDEGPVAIDEPGDEATEVAEQPEAEPEPADEQPAEEGEEQAEPEDGPDESLLDAAPDPEDTTVQVLDAGAGSDATDDAVEALEELGYDIIVVNASSSNLDATTVRWTTDNEAAGEALRERDGRFTVVEENTGLSDAVDLHVLVGADWDA